MYYSIGVISYIPSIDRDSSSPYELGDIVPVITGISKFDKYDWIIYWLENTIEGLKVGDAIAFDVIANEMKELKVVEGLGVRVAEDVFDKAERRASIPI